ncbi:MAG: trehalose-phosphatase [Bacteroidota bacterium]|nr:trehalose-phosphatase [Bacteroidota bacterium]
MSRPNSSSDQLPSALEHFDRIASKFKDRQLIVCLDYDGTLTPIVEQYDQAIVNEEMRALVQELSAKVTVAIVSGRDVAFIQKHMRIADAFYAGSHGFEIIGPNAFHNELDEAKDVIPIFDRVEEELRALFPSSSKVEIERKKFAMAVHYRNAPPELVPEVKNKVDAIIGKHDSLKAGRGKMVIELRPAMDWHKGKAVEVIVDRLDRNNNAYVIYIGDDVTDEDAFRSITNGTGILVGSHGEATAAEYGLNDVGEVKSFLQMLNESR